MSYDAEKHLHPIEFVPARVDCHSGYKAEETPLRFTAAGGAHEIAAVLDRWYEGGVSPTAPVIDYFRVWDGAGGTWLLRHDRAADAWTAAALPTPPARGGA